MQRMKVTPNIGKAKFGIANKGALQKKKVDPCTKCPLKPPEGSVCPSFQKVIDVPDRSPKKNKNLMIVVGSPEGNAYCIPGEFSNIIQRCKKETTFTDVVVTPVVKCRCIKAAPPKKSIEACFNRFKQDMEAAKPDIVVCVGKAAAVPFGLGGKLDDLLDVIHEVDGMPKRTLVLVTPDMEKILEDPLEEKRFEATIAKANRMADADFTGEDLEYYLFDNPEEFRLWANTIRPDAALSCDIETPGLDFQAPDARIRTIAFSYREKLAFGVIVEDSPELYLKYLKEFLESGRRFIFHNAEFDVLYLREVAKIKVNSLFADTMLMLFAWQPYRGNFKLKPAAQEFTPLGAYDTEVKDGEWGTIDARVLVTYNMCDSDATGRIFKIVYAALKKNKQEEMIPLMTSHVEVLMEFRKNGVLIDQEFVRDVTPRIEALLEGYEQELVAILGKKYDWNSPQDLDHLLYSILKLKRPVGVNKRYATGDAILDQLNHPVAELIRKYRKAFRICNTYFKSYFSKTSSDGRLRAKYFLYITATGRTSSRDPNFQNLPRGMGEDEPGYEDLVKFKVKNAIIARPGWTLVAADQSQVEMRIAAMFSKDKALMSVYKNRLDFHSASAKAAFSITKDMTADREELIAKGMVEGSPEFELELYRRELIKIKKQNGDARTRAKSVSFGVLYGMSKYGLKYDLDNKTRKEGRVWTFEECQEYIDRFHAAYPTLSRWLDIKVAESRKQGFISSAFGRRRYILGEFTHKNEREAKNTPIQVTASDLMLLGIRAILDEVDTERCLICASVHDSVVCEVRDDYLEEAIPIIKRCLENPKLNGKKPDFINIPLLAEVEIGKRYGDMKEAA
jgi:DNA polymerase-1